MLSDDGLIAAGLLFVEAVVRAAAPAPFLWKNCNKFGWFLSVIVVIVGERFGGWLPWWDG